MGKVSKLDADKVFSFHPTLWSKEGSNINKSSRKAVPVEEQYNLNIGTCKQLGLNKENF
ncbi:DUF2625 family protein [Pedobacter sp. R-06]|uniref:DUF2625 family protein n=1 Tax=Pedobacter sp. R-06 TaxID=3404051 RepID=UPI003CE6BE3B